MTRVQGVSFETRVKLLTRDLSEDHEASGRSTSSFDANKQHGPQENKWKAQSNNTTQMRGGEDKAKALNVLLIELRTKKLLHIHISSAKSAGVHVIR